MTKDEGVNKDSAENAFDEHVAVIRKEIDEHNERLKSMAQKLNDPVYLAGMMLAVQNERENTNRILKNIYAELEKVKSLSLRVEKLEGLAGSAKGSREDVMLSQIDEQIIGFVGKKGRICAADVQREFKYKGKNGASARLNSLFELGFLKKIQAGRTVYYTVRNHE